MRFASKLYRVVEVCRVGRAQLKKVPGFYHPDLDRVRRQAEFTARHSMAIRVYISDDQGQVVCDVPVPIAAAG